MLAEREGFARLVSLRGARGRRDFDDAALVDHERVIGQHRAGRLDRNQPARLHEQVDLLHRGREGASRILGANSTRASSPMTSPVQPIAWNDGLLRLLDQRLLPLQERYLECRTPQEVADAIRQM